jgi:hypothetical protein
VASIRELAIQNIVTKLNTNRPGGMAQFIRSFSWAVDPSMLPFNIVYPQKDAVLPPDRETRPIRQKVQRVAVEVIFKGDGTTPPDSAVDATLVWAQKATLGTHVDQLYSNVEYGGTEFHRAQADYPYCRAIIYLDIHHQSDRNDPELWSKAA